MDGETKKKENLTDNGRETATFLHGQQSLDYLFWFKLFLQSVASSAPGKTPVSAFL